MKITGLERTIADLNKSITFQSKSLFEEIGEYIKTQIKLRTSDGVDYEGNAFEPYSLKYKLFRKKKEYPVNKVDLFYSGSMMGSMTYTATPDSVRVFFAPGTDEDEDKVQNASKAFWLNENREFFMYSQKDLDKVIDMYVRRANDAA